MLIFHVKFWDCIARIHLSVAFLILPLISIPVTNWLHTSMYYRYLCLRFMWVILCILGEISIVLQFITFLNFYVFECWFKENKVVCPFIQQKLANFLEVSKLLYEKTVDVGREVGLAVIARAGTFGSLGDFIVVGIGAESLLGPARTIGAVVGACVGGGASVACPLAFSQHEVSVGVVVAKRHVLGTLRRTILAIRCSRWWTFKIFLSLKNPSKFHSMLKMASGYVFHRIGACCAQFG